MKFEASISTEQIENEPHIQVPGEEHTTLSSLHTDNRFQLDDSSSAKVLSNISVTTGSIIQNGENSQTAIVIASSSDKEHGTHHFPNGKSKDTALSIESSQRTEGGNLEQFEERDFITFHRGVNDKVYREIKHFQQINTNNLSLYCSSRGIYGSLVEEIGSLFRNICKQPLYKGMYYYSIGTSKLGAIDIRYKTLEILLAGIRFEQQDRSTRDLIHFSKLKDRYLTDEHLELIRYMLLTNKVQYMNHLPPIQEKCLIVNSFFAELLEDNPEGAMNCLISLMTESGLFSQNMFLLEVLLVPINIGNYHWILGIIDFKNQTFYALDPQRPRYPSTQELKTVENIALGIVTLFKGSLPEDLVFTVLPSQNAENLPVQRSGDGFNCGVYVSIYMMIYYFGHRSYPFWRQLLPDSIDECRLLMLAWILRGEIFFLDQHAI